MLLRRQPLDEATRAARKCDHATTLDVHFVNPAQGLAVESLDL
jgi:hypothetical protein